MKRPKKPGSERIKRNKQYLKDWLQYKYMIVEKSDVPGENKQYVKLRDKIRSLAFKYKIKENPDMIPTLIKKATAYIHRSCPRYIPRLKNKH